MMATYQGYTAAELAAMPRLRSAGANTGHHGQYKATTITAEWLPGRDWTCAGDPDYAAPTNYEKLRRLCAEAESEP